jgi:hypothetical protein
MMLFRRPLIAAFAAAAALAVGAPAASASTVPTYPFSVPAGLTRFADLPIGAMEFPSGFPMGACSAASAEGQGRTGGNDNQSCGLLSFIGPSTAVSTVIGPTIITASYAGSSIVAGGNVAIAP